MVQWVSSYNFLSLLNLGDEIARLGPPRGHYEGSFRGEKIVSKIKPIIKGGLVGGWAENTLRNYWLAYVDGALNGNKFDDEVDGETKESSRGKMMKVYQNLADVIVSISTGLPISACIDTNNQRYVVIAFGGRNETSQLFPVTFQEATGVDYCGMRYAEVEIEHDNYTNIRPFSSVAIADYSLLLPMIHDAPQPNDNNNNNAFIKKCVLYTEITHKWSNEMTARFVTSYR